MLSLSPPGEDRTSVLNAKPRRSRLDICFELMEVIWTREEIKPTQLMYKANLSWRMLSEILSYLSEKGVVSFTEVGSRRMITLTEKGTSCLQRLHEARSALMSEAGDGSEEFGRPGKVFPSSVVTQIPQGKEKRAW